MHPIDTGATGVSKLLQPAAWVAVDTMLSITQQGKLISMANPMEQST
jgi:hypothetical protein